MTAANGLGAAVRAMIGWVRESEVAWPEFARAITRGDLRAEWEGYAVDIAELGLGLTGRDMLQHCRKFSPVWTNQTQRKPGA